MQSSNVSKVREIVKKYDHSRQKIIFMLHEIQEVNGENYITEEYINVLAEELNIPVSEVYDVMTFYSMFEEKPRGKYIIEVCNSGPCFVRNYKKVVKVLEDMLGIKVGETTEDKLFTVQYTSCIGACDIAPVMKIGEEVYGNLTEEKIKKVIDEYRGGVVCHK